jgi:hypothetical protein
VPRSHAAVAPPSPVAIRPQVERASQGSLSLLVASSGLQVCGQGAWHAQQHGAKKSTRWKKRPRGVAAQGQIGASAVTASSGQDPARVPALLAPVAREIERCSGDGMDDQERVDAAVMDHALGASVSIPPRKDAGWRRPVATAPTHRDHHRLALERAGRFGGTRASGSYAQADAEHVFARCKRTCGDRLRAKREASRAWDASLAGTWLNRMRARGRPQS